MTTPTRQGGFYLVEVMLTVIVLTVGLLALSALHIHNKQTNLVAVQRSFATQLSHDLLERMRSNGLALNIYIGGSSNELDGDNVSQPTPLCTSDAQCTAEQLAAYDLWEWERKLAGAMSTLDGASTGILLSPHVCIAGPNGGTSGAYTIVIAWRSTKPIGNPTDTGNDVADDCGTGTGKYDVASGDNQMRHIYFVESFLSAT